jgi:dihydrofolate synthase/folylpolyglutamate synthase
MYQRTGGANYKIDLEKTWAMVKALGNPHEGVPYFHVAGTNGKGSTSHMLASILQEQWYRVGLYTSPHLIDFRERIKINGKEISEEYVVKFVQENQQVFVDLQLSFFEMTVGLAFCYFKELKADVVVLEVGMGGRLDSTNVVKPLVSVITNIGLDHQKFLGDTLPEIAGEKAGIIKQNVPVVIGETQSEIIKVFRSKAESLNAPITFADQKESSGYKTDLKGKYQEKNVQTAVVALRAQNELQVDEESIERGLLNVVKNTGLLGRWQILRESPLVVCDTGHNLEGVSQIVEQLNTMTFKRLLMVWGMVDDKNVEQVLKILPQAQFFFTQASIPRALHVEKLQAAASQIGIHGQAYTTVIEAIKSALAQMEENDLLFIGGSTFVVADALKDWGKLKS